jgi:hypothetical protein
MNGIAAKPESHQGFVENPLVPVDYVNVSVLWLRMKTASGL